MGIEEQVSDRPETIGVIAGSFDLFHTGHIIALADAKKYCDQLVVLLQTDPSIDRPLTKNKPVQSITERMIQIQACRYVDHACPYDTEEDLLNMLKINKFDVRFLDENYKGHEFTGCDLDIPIIYLNRQHSYSTSELRRRVYNAELVSVMAEFMEALPTDPVYCQSPRR